MHFSLLLLDESTQLFLDLLEMIIEITTILQKSEKKKLKCIYYIVIFCTSII